MTERVTIVIPVLNEEDSLRKQVYALRAYLDSSLDDIGPIRIVIADNGSTDATRTIASELASSVPHVGTVFVKERGVGRALKAAWSESSSEFVGYMDLDLATDLDALRPVLAALESGKADIVNGSRLLPASEVRGRRPLRNVTSRAFNAIVQRTFRTSFTDGMCGFKFLRRSILPSLRRGGATSDGWFYATQLLVAAEKCGHRVLEVPVTWTDDPASKVNVVKLSTEYLGEIVRLRRNLRVSRHG